MLNILMNSIPMQFIYHHNIYAFSVALKQKIQHKRFCKFISTLPSCWFVRLSGKRHGNKAVGTCLFIAAIDEQHYSNELDQTGTTMRNNNRPSWQARCFLRDALRCVVSQEKLQKRSIIGDLFHCVLEYFTNLQSSYNSSSTFYNNHSACLSIF